MDTSLVIVDDFLANAWEFRERALKLEYPTLEISTAYPGRNSVQRLLLPDLEQQVSRILNTRLRVKEGTGHGRFRVTLKEDKGHAHVHVDNSHWSGIYFLSRPEDCFGGTEFFRHISTGTDRALLEPQDIEKLGVASREEANRLFQNILVNDSNDRSKWERIMTVPMKFNRLILFRPWLWHTAGPGFGDTLENGRLVYLLFFEMC